MSLKRSLESGIVDRPLNILQVGWSDVGGGAEQVAMELAKRFRAREHHSRTAVGYKRSSDPNVLEFPKIAPNPWTRSWARLGREFRARSNQAPVYARLDELCHDIAAPETRIRWHLGHENFNFPASRKLLSLTDSFPDVVHCHNLHGQYFDLRYLAQLSHQVPTIVTLHDAWLLSGHCAHSLNCERWRTGCGQCIDLTLYPSVKRDATAYNWKRKRQIYSKSQLYIGTPCHWLMRKVEGSILKLGAKQCRVIPNGVDLSVFKPADKLQTRDILGLPRDARILLFVASAIRKNRWKDYEMLQATLSKLASSAHNLLLLAVGEQQPDEKFGNATLRFVPYQSDRKQLARYYQAADVYLHAARAETFPTVILEALACALPVVATAVGGIPEQIDDGKTGYLVAPGDANAMAEKALAILSDTDLSHSLRANAAQTARARFDLDQTADAYLHWYREILAEHHS